MDFLRFSYEVTPVLQDILADKLAWIGAQLYRVKNG